MIHANQNARVNFLQVLEYLLKFFLPFSFIFPFDQQLFIKNLIYVDVYLVPQKYQIAKVLFYKFGDFTSS